MVGPLGKIIFGVLPAVEPGQDVVRIVAVVFVRVGADQRGPVHDLGDLRQQFADLRPGNRAGDRLQLAADIGGSLRLEVEHVLMGRASEEVDQDHRLGLRGGCSRSGSGE